MEVIGGHPVAHEPATFIYRKGGQQPPGLHWAHKHWQQVRGGDPSAVVNLGETELKCCAQCWAPQDKMGTDVLEQVQYEATEFIKRVDYLTRRG